MCGRFACSKIPKPLQEEFSITEVPEFKPRYNIAPSQDALAVFRSQENGVPVLKMVRWGLVPSWRREGETAGIINARMETVAEKPSFRDSVRNRRCLIPADGYYEWKKDGRVKQPYYATPVKDGSFIFAGIWDEWKGAGQTFAIITTQARGKSKEIHDRMPLILPREHWQGWLAHAPEGRAGWGSLSDAFSDEDIKWIRVSAYVNNTRNEGIRCIQPEEPLLEM